MFVENKCCICNTADPVTTIQDAKDFPERYNGKPICKDCEELRQLLKNTP